MQWRDIIFMSRHCIVMDMFPGANASGKILR